MNPAPLSFSSLLKPCLSSGGRLLSAGPLLSPLQRPGSVRAAGRPAQRLLGAASEERREEAEREGGQAEETVPGLRGYSPLTTTLLIDGFTYFYTLT